MNDIDVTDLAGSASEETAEGWASERRLHYDAFISFSSIDRRFARWIQRFLEGWKDRSSRRRLRVFLDETDLRSGSLDQALREAAHAARTLVICYSPAAAESRWVAAEVDLFRRKSEADRIAVAVVDGPASVAEVGKVAVAGLEVRVHDLRRPLWLTYFGLGPTIELLRLLAFVADVEMRALRNWYLRRTLRNALLFVTFAVAPVGLLLNASVADWEQIELSAPSVDGSTSPVYAIAAEVKDEMLSVATRFRAPGPQGFRDYIRVIPDVLGDPKPTFNPFITERRVLPRSVLALEIRDRIPSVDLAGLTSRAPVEEPWFCQVAATRAIEIVPLAPTEEELDRARDLAADLQTPIPQVNGSVVAAIDGDRVLAQLVPDLSPVWDRIDGSLGPTSPARGIAVAWTPEGEIWLGVQGRDGREPGGLWRRLPGEGRWKKVPGFESVASIEVDIRDGKTERVTVSERHLERWRNGILEPSPTRVMGLAVGQTEWQAASAPPFGTRSEVELVGRLAGVRVVRVDENLFRERSMPLWRFLWWR